jgi:H+/Na+-translocating ferredoxin:NAD+ oxidoreductase subunit D
MADSRRDPPTLSPLAVSPAPHLVGLISSARLSWSVACSLLPAAAWGIFLFGLPALRVLGVAVATALITDALASLAWGRVALRDGSAAVTGLLVGMLMTPGVPLYVPAVASAFGILVVKQSFGGLGRNWMNPALGGVVFALFSWADAATRWLPARGAAAGAAMAPLSALRSALAGGKRAAGSALTVLGANGYPWSGLDGRVVTWVNAHVLSLIGLSLPGGSFDMLVGNIPGRIGDVSIPLLALGAAFLLARRVIKWHVPVTYLATFLVAAQLFGGLPMGRGWFAGGALFQLFSGSIVLGAFFMATDPVTSPLTRPGKLIYGVCLGLLTFFLRYFGTPGLGVPLAIVLGNCISPLLDRFAKPGFVSRRKAEAA